MIGGSSEELMDEMRKGLIDEGTLDGGRGREGVEVGQFEEDLPPLMVTTFASEERKGESMIWSTIDLDSIGRLSEDAVRSRALLSVVYILGPFPTTSSYLWCGKTRISFDVEQ